MPKLEVTLTIDKGTKGAVRYREVDQPGDSVFPVIYIRREALKLLGDPSPVSIKVTVEAES